LGSVASKIKTSEVRALAVVSQERVPLIPELQTMREAGLSEFIEPTWIGVFTTAGVPNGILAKINRDINRATLSDEVATHLETIGLTVKATESLEALQTMMKDDNAKWTAIITKAGLAGSQ
jgi:tripartite-type tricarboxylate transporter receptor subunit TctC